MIGSHYHFIEVNKNLVFDRSKSYGMRLDVPAGNAIRFEPGEIKFVSLVEIGGAKVITGGNNLCNGAFSKDNLPEIMNRVTALGFGNEIQCHDFPWWALAFSRSLFRAILLPANVLQFLVLKTK
ncbi:urease [Trichonephila clavipes]|nr:urease [Trichonephila clavipes]